MSATLGMSALEPAVITFAGPAIILSLPPNREQQDKNKVLYIALQKNKVLYVALPPFFAIAIPKRLRY